MFVSKGERLSSLELQFLPETAKLLSLEMQKDQFGLSNKATYFTHLLSDMLRGKRSGGVSYEERFLAFSHHLQRWKRLAIILLTPQLLAKENVNVLARTLQTLFDNSVYLIQDDHLVFLLSKTEMTPFTDDEMATWREYFGTNQLKVGISGFFEDSPSAKTYLEQAKKALELGAKFAPEESVYIYDEYRLLDMIHRLSAENDIYSFCYPPLLRLLEVDKTEGNGQLTQTLYCYLQRQQTVSTTCQNLYIHRNTLYYRLEKVKEIMCCDLSDANTVGQINSTFLILRYLGLFDYKDFSASRNP